MSLAQRILLKRRIALESIEIPSLTHKPRLCKKSKVFSLSLSRKPQQAKKTIKAFDSNIHKLDSKTKELNPDVCHSKEAERPKNLSTKDTSAFPQYDKVISLNAQSQTKQPTLFPIYEDKDLNNAGDFRSKECLALLKRCDIVVTNPPFSLFREFVATLIESKKKFVIIGNQNNITYKDIFSFIKEGKLWLGRSLSYAAFQVPEYYEERSNRFWIDESGQKWRSFGNICWFTNLEHKKRSEILETIYSYEKDKDKYPKYDNYDVINVDKVTEIPMDYTGVMGVPITFLDKHNPKQFEILGLDNHLINNGLGAGCNSINGKQIYRRLIIRQIKSVKELKDEEE